MISKSTLISIALISLFVLVQWYESKPDKDAASSPALQSNQKSSRQASIQNGSSRDYQSIRPVFWSQLYAQGGNSLYCGERFSAASRQGLNVEHVFPMSWVTNSLDCGTRKQCRVSSKIFNQIEADMHNLYPARQDVNQDRASFRFAEIAGEERPYGKNCDFEVDRRARMVEPAPAVRGEVARSMFYMAYQYRDQGLTIFAKQAKLLAAWHNADPPDEMERKRNTLINQLQGNRNLFINKPQELDRLLASGYFNN